MATLKGRIKVKEEERKRMAPEGATLTTEIIVPQKGGGSSEVF